MKIKERTIVAFHIGRGGRFKTLTQYKLYESIQD